MRAAALRLSAVVLAGSVAGCGLLLDYDPPDTRDVGVMDAAVRDGAIDATTLDSSDDATSDDAMVDAFARDAPDAPPIDGGPSSPCFGLADGDSCGGSGMGPMRRICIGGACVPSSCGDGFVDTSGGEQCEPPDPNCPPLTCRYECSSDSDCPVVSACFAASCSGHRCTYVADHGGTTCTTPDGVSGTCALGVCVPPGCGNAMVEAGEECDPGTSSFTGCHGCHFDCHADGECSDGDPCNGIEICAILRDAGTRIVGRQCQPGTAFTCPMPMACYAGGCVPDSIGDPSCPMRLIDADGDGFAHGDACPGGVGGDCDDGNPRVHPGAPEICNMVDDDCNGFVDDGTVSVTWCLDADGDGYGAMSSATTSCMQPVGPFVRDCTDCWDTGDAAHRSEAALVHPMQDAFFTTPYCPSGGSTCSFDYDCDRNDVPQVGNVVNCGLLAPLLCASSAGWAGSVPACGATGTFDTCHSPLIGLLCRVTTAPQTQACH